MRVGRNILLGVVMLGSAGIVCMACLAIRKRDRPDTRPATTAGRGQVDGRIAKISPSSLGEDIYVVKLAPLAMRRTSEDNHLFVAKGTVLPGEHTTREFVLPRCARITAVLIGDDIRYGFRSPGGEWIIPGETKNRATYQFGRGEQGVATFTLEHPEGGTWTARVEGVGSTGEASYAVDIRSDGFAEEGAHLETMLRDSDPAMSFLAKPGDPVFVRVYVASHGSPVRGTQWDVRALTTTERPIDIPVYDDGHHADGEAGDGVYVGAIVAEGPDGVYQIRASGHLLTGTEYVVTGSIEVQAQNDLLIADRIMVDPVSPEVGKPVTLTVTAMNAGTINSQDVELEFYLDGRKVSSQKFDLMAGESKQIMTTWTPAAVNSYDVQLTINPTDEPYASNFANNTQTTVVRVH